ncbi:hypothetical protein LCGC14_1117330 [marine sediment metagenome]|uniref:Uncharacterized protein n=1 Tax=marine sediment metagenome TaxID=412755 RepID=A0A0F9PN24_9ZZZZ
MKKLNNIEVEIAAEYTAKAWMCNHGVKNAKRIAYKTWKWLKAEEKRQKEKSK